VRRHKERNLTDHLPEVKPPLVLRRLRVAWAEPDPPHANAQLEAIARGLGHQRPGAAAAVREGLAETLTVNRLAATGSLLRTLESTNPVERINPVESMIEIVRDPATRVEHEESGEMALRWAAVGMFTGEAQFPATALRRAVGLSKEAAMA
jgi:putative transposase